MLPFQPGAFPAYVSLWIYVGIPPGLLLGFRELVVYGLWAAGLCVTGLLFFHFLPTSVPLYGIDPELARHPAFALIQGVDASGNACPSMHVASATFSAICLDRLLRGIGAPRLLLALNGVWLLLIVHSTLAIRQHVVLDVLAGAVLGAVFAAAALRWRPAAPHAFNPKISGYHS
jgi:membrane-associated phospholipid phosphatase